jgi:hypothetical protein
MSSTGDHPSGLYEGIAQEYPNLQWADSRCDRKVTNSSEDDEQDEGDEQAEEDGYTDVYRDYIEGSEKDGDYITLDIGTGSRSGGGDSYEDTSTGFTNADVGEVANKQDSDFKSSNTYFDVEEVSEDRKNKFERLRDRNSGVREDWWGQYYEWKKTFEDARFFAERLGLPKYQIEEVVLHTGNLDFQGGRRKEQLMLALITIVDDKYMRIPENPDEGEYEKYMENRVSETPMFHSFLDSVRMDKGDLMQVRQMVRDQLSYQP